MAFSGSGKTALRFFSLSFPARQGIWTLLSDRDHAAGAITSLTIGGKAMGKLGGKVANVTGPARGLGRAYAKRRRARRQRSPIST